MKGDIKIRFLPVNIVHYQDREAEYNDRLYGAAPKILELLKKARAELAFAHRTLNKESAILLVDGCGNEIDDLIKGIDNP